MNVPVAFLRVDAVTAITFIDAQLEKINLQALFAKEQEWLEMIWILHAAYVDSGKGKKLGLELLFNQMGGVFKPDEEVLVEDDSLQAAPSAQVRKTNFEN